MSFQQTIENNVLAIRTAAAQFLVDTCVIKRKLADTVVKGDSITNYDDPETIACRLIIRSGTDSSNIAAQERAISQTAFTGIYRLQLPYGTSIDVDDRIEFTDTEGTRKFDVIFVPPFNKMMGAFIITIKEAK
jgi:hypothetical protein